MATKPDKQGTKKEASTIKKAEKKYSNTDEVSKMVHQGVQKGKIKFEDMVETADTVAVHRNWKGIAQKNGAVVSFGYMKKKGTNTKGKEFNPRYKILILHKEETQEFSGTFARKIYLRLVNPPKKRTSKLSEDASTFVSGALSGIQ